MKKNKLLYAAGIIASFVSGVVIEKKVDKMSRTVGDLVVDGTNMYLAINSFDDINKREVVKLKVIRK